MRTVRTTGQFQVEAALSGRVFTVIERTEFVWTERFNGPASIPWHASFETAEGYSLTPLGEDRFEIAALGLCVQRVASQKLNGVRIPTAG